MRKTTLSLEELCELLVTDKQASGRSSQTIHWYAGAIERYGQWLERQGATATLEFFTLDLVRRYVTDLQRQPADAFHPYMPTQPRPLADSTVNCYVRALRGFSTWLFEEGYTSEPCLRG